ncbi:F-actin-uncapping protein LRRC16A-like isoform X1 [Triplophysa rosa]|uniref:Leucine-rich repeat-containing protein 16A-like n=1 Tax=Triplophysa rosa TaxID=992332 RepID=A0A9W8C3D3_TRIRA|nr:F-actin-uncapping protein LRRC16A-like isoform X1 [Triplophysa rosa]KAI7806786.1 putative leucine-rich repeat-containing protein 16A-like [Triplophysa rosa]
MTPKSKRKSIHSRMLRPVSRAFEMEFDLDKALEHVPIHIEDPSPPPKLEKKPSTTMAELPSEECKKLQHYTKLRPKRNKKTNSSKIPSVSSTPPQEGEQNGLMGRVDEGVDEFFSKKVTKVNDHKRTSLKSSESQDGDKKRESRKGGFLNLIKSRSSKDKDKDKEKDKEKHQASAAAPAPSQTAPLAAEEPSSPKGPVRSPPPDTKAKSQTPPTNHSSGSERSEEPKTPDSVDSELSEGSPQGSRRYGVQVMGSGLLAEMKAKQEKRSPFSSHKVSESSPSSDKTDGPSSGKGHSPESRSSAITKTEGSVSRCSGEGKPETAQRPRASTSTTTPTSPKPLLQGTKPALAARPAIPQKPRTSSVRSIDESSDSPTGGPKGPGLRRMPSDKEGTSKNSAQEDISVFETDSELDKSISASRVRSAQQRSQDESHEEHSTPLARPVRTSTATDPSQKSSRLNSEETGCKSKDTPANGSKDSSQSSKSAESGEEANKDFILNEN